MRAEIERSADLLYAFQAGQETVRYPDKAEALKAEFAATFAEDAEAQQEFEDGIASETAKSKK